MKAMKKEGKLVSARYGEWQASLFGACFIAFGLGVILQQYIGKGSWLIILVGIILHSWGMNKTYQRNK